MEKRIQLMQSTSFLVFVWMFFFLFFLLPVTVLAAAFNTSIPTVADPRYEVQILVPGSYFHGIHGITFDTEDNLYAGSVVGQNVYKIDTNTGAVTEFIGPPVGMADDLEFGPDGRLYYTSYLQGKFRVRNPDGTVVELADGLMGLNSLAFSNDGRLFSTQVFLGDALYEIDLSGNKNTRKIAEKFGGLNGFDFGPDNMLYGPLWFKQCIARVDVDTGKVEIVAKGFQTPAAVNFDSKGNLFAVDTAAGEVIQVDIKTGKKTVIAKVDPSIDNLAIDSKDRIYITNMANNGIYEIDKKTGKARTVVEGKLSCATGVAVSTGDDGDTLYIADIFSFRKVDGFTGEVATLLRSHAAGSHIHYPNSISVYRNHAILIGSSTGTLHIIDTKTIHDEKMLSGFKGPGHALMLDDGSIIVTEMGTGSLLKVTGEEGNQRAVIAKDLVVPSYIALAGKDAVYVTEVMAGNVTQVNLADGAKIVVASGLKLPKSVGVLPDGKLVVVEAGKQQLVEIDPASGAIKPLVTNLAVGYPPNGPPPGLTAGLAVSDAGNIYVTGDIENVLYKIRKK